MKTQSTSQPLRSSLIPLHTASFGLGRTLLSHPAHRWLEADATEVIA